MATTFGDPKALAMTYDPAGQVDAWNLVEQFREVIDYAARHPDQGSSAIANRLDLPRGRIRPWLNTENPATPDVVKGIRTAEDYGWLHMDPNSPTFGAINRLVAWVFSGGSITTTYVPRFAVTNDADRERVEDLLDRAGTGATLARETEGRHGAEMVPATDASVLGRLLASLGAPVGSKNTDRSIHLPAYLDDAPDSRRRAFAETYVRNRGTHVGKPAAHIQIKEDRPAAYLEELRLLLASVVDGEVRRQESGQIHLDETAAEGFDLS